MSLIKVRVNTPLVPAYRIAITQKTTLDYLNHKISAECKKAFTDGRAVTVVQVLKGSNLTKRDIARSLGVTDGVVTHLVKKGEDLLSSGNVRRLKADTSKGGKLK